MKNSLLITKYIRTILEQDSKLMKMIPIDHFYPVDAKQGTKFPFAVIIRTGMQDNISKDGIYEDIINISIIVVDDNYFGSIEIINEIRNWLEGHRYKNDEICITRFQMTSTSESFYNNAFLQEITLNVYIQNV